MGALIFGYGVSIFFLAVALAGRRKLERGTLDMDAGRAVDLRRSAESPWGGAVTGGFSFLAVVGGTFLLVRGQPIGWAWFGVAVLLAIVAVIGRGNSRRLLVALGDRGHVERSSRYRSRAAMTRRWAAAAFGFYIATRVIKVAYPDGVPDVAVTIYYVLMVAFAACLAIFLVLRGVMWFQGNDLERPERSAPSQE